MSTSCGLTLPWRSAVAIGRAAPNWRGSLMPLPLARRICLGCSGESPDPQRIHSWEHPPLNPYWRFLARRPLECAGGAFDLERHGSKSESP